MHWPCASAKDSQIPLADFLRSGSCRDQYVLGVPPEVQNYHCLTDPPELCSVQPETGFD